MNEEITQIQTQKLTFFLLPSFLIVLVPNHLFHEEISFFKRKIINIQKLRVLYYTDVCYVKNGWTHVCSKVIVRACYECVYVYYLNTCSQVKIIIEIYSLIETCLYFIDEI